MSILGAIKDLVLLPVDIVLDATMITPASRIVRDTNHDTPFGTFDRLGSLGINLDETFD